MIDGNKKISLSKVDLIEFFEFYKNEICNFSYKYTFEDKRELILSFKEENFSHLLGLHKFKKVKSYKLANDVNRDILSNKIILKDLMSTEKNVMDSELKDRITYFPMLKKLLSNTDTALEYNINSIFNTKIKFSFLLNTSKISVIIYLAVKEIGENKKVCIPVSFLVDRQDRFSKMNLKKLKIENIEILKK